MSHTLVRYVLNGLFATAVHFLVLTLLIEGLQMASAGAANFIAAGFGITASFLGNRFFVFAYARGPLAYLAVRFLLLYAGIAVVHGLTLALWTDWLALDYRIGFLLATFLQFALSYSGNRWLVFR
ncbi:GtrA family protein [Spiribacter sp. C176]|uniref:GtrA family protein n=1 Tax=Spiribacter salilacus TaxID=2664894 RepID=A0A6N7QSS6_9GAMM|nr:GtrA family protein [Spiribacter salilacus]MRH79042.1 GtrA family protein [Spiribacter salilacus]